jgi:hypothetical protein
VSRRRLAWHYASYGNATGGGEAGPGRARPRHVAGKCGVKRSAPGASMHEAPCARRVHASLGGESIVSKKRNSSVHAPLRTPRHCIKLSDLFLVDEQLAWTSDSLTWTSFRCRVESSNA